LGRLGEIGIHVEAEVLEVLEDGKEAFDLDLFRFANATTR